MGWIGMEWIGTDWYKMDWDGLAEEKGPPPCGGDKRLAAAADRWLFGGT